MLFVNIALVFHRILDFKTGLDFYPGPFLFFNMIRILSHLTLVDRSLIIVTLLKLIFYLWLIN